MDDIKKEVENLGDDIDGAEDEAESILDAKIDPDLE